MKLIGLFSLYLIWGGTYLATKYSLETLPPFMIGTLRFFISGVILLLIANLKKEPGTSKKQFLYAAMSGFLMVAIGNGMIVFAQQVISSGISALWIATVPMWIMIINFLFFDKKNPQFSAWLGSFCAFVGLTFLLNLDFMHLSQSFGLHQICLLISPVAWALGTLLLKKVDISKQILRFTAHQMLIGSFFFFTFALLHQETLSLENFHLKTVLSLGFLILFGSVLAFSVFSWLITLIPPHIVATYAFVNPLIAVLLGVTIANEEFNKNLYIAIPLIVGGVAMILLGPKKSSRS